MRIDLDFTDKEIGIIRDALFELSRSPSYALDKKNVLDLLEDINESIAIEEQNRELYERGRKLGERRYIKDKEMYPCDFDIPVNLEDGEPV